MIDERADLFEGRRLRPGPSRNGHRAALADANNKSTIVADVVSGKGARYLSNTLTKTLSSKKTAAFSGTIAIDGPAG